MTTTYDGPLSDAVLATDTATNKAIAYRAQYELLVEKDFDTLDRNWKQDYIQHNPSLRNGLEELRAFKLANVPNAETELLLCLGDNDLVFFLERVSGLMPHTLCFFDVYRMEDGKVTEHWDAYVPVDGPNPSGRTLYDGTKDIGDPAHTEATRATVVKLVNNVFVLDHLDRLGDYVHDDVLQYSAGIADGLAGLQQHLVSSQWFTGPIAYRALRQVVTEGDFAVTGCEVLIGGREHLIYDLWRVVDGKVAEHWSLRMPVEPSPYHSNPRI